VKSQGPDTTSAYFALAGALGAALLAIIGNQFAAWRQRIAESKRLKEELDAADRRMRTQLEAELERLERTLAAEAERQQQALEHDRHLRELVLIREVLTAVEQAVSSSSGPMVRLRSAVAQAVEEPSEGAALEILNRSADVRAAGIEIREKGNPARAILGSTTGVVADLYRVADAAGDLADFAWDLRERQVTPDDVIEAERLDDLHTEAVITFRESVWTIVKAWTPTPLPETEEDTD
jgi:hypothetical protein